MPNGNPCDRNTYRTVYAVKLGDEIYVLHCFQKKSTIGIKTPKKEIDLIKRRLKIAQELAVERVARNEAIALPRFKEKEE